MKKKSIEELMRNPGYYRTLVESLNKKNVINEQYDGLETLRDDIVEAIHWYREDINKRHLPVDTSDYADAIIDTLENYLTAYPEVTVYDILSKDDLEGYLVNCLSENSGEIDDEIVADYVIAKVGDSDEFDIDSLEIQFPEDDEY